MKRGTPWHDKVDKIAEALEVPLFSAVGLVEMLFHYAANYCADGAVGKRFEHFAKVADWQGSAGDLFAAFELAGWLDWHAERGDWLIHDWSEHCEDAVHKKLDRAGKLFADGSWPSDRLGHKRAKFYRCLHAGGDPLIDIPEKELPSAVVRALRGDGTLCLEVTNRPGGLEVSGLPTPTPTPLPTPRPSLSAQSAGAAGGGSPDRMNGGERVFENDLTAAEGRVIEPDGGQGKRRPQAHARAAGDSSRVTEDGGSSRSRAASGGAGASAPAQEGDTRDLSACENVAEKPGDYGEGRPSCPSGATEDSRRPTERAGPDRSRDAFGVAAASAADIGPSRPDVLEGIEARKWEAVTPWDHLAAGWHDAFGVTMFYTPTAADLGQLAQLAAALEADGMDAGAVLRRVPKGFAAQVEPKIKTPHTLLKLGYINHILPRVVSGMKAAERQAALKKREEQVRAEERASRKLTAGPTKADKILEGLRKRRTAN